MLQIELAVVLVFKLVMLGHQSQISSIITRKLNSIENITLGLCYYQYAWIDLAFNDSALIYPYSHSKTCSQIQPISTFSMCDLTNLNLLLKYSNYSLWKKTKSFFLSNKINGNPILAILRNGNRREIHLKVFDKLELTKPQNILCYTVSCVTTTSMISSTDYSSYLSTVTASSTSIHPLSDHPEFRKQILIYRIAVLLLIVFALCCLSVASYFALLYKQERKSFKELQNSKTNIFPRQASSSKTSSVNGNIV